MYESQYGKDNQVKMAFRDGMQGFKSDGADTVVEHLDHYPVTIVLFFDNQLYSDVIMRSLAIKLLDVFLFKYE